MPSTSKKPSARKPRSPPELTFFSDRCLGRRIFPDRLREAGVRLVAYHEDFPDDPQVPDWEWIRHACRRGHVCLTHDRATRKEDRTMEEVFDPALDPRGSLFLLRGSLSAAELAELFVSALPEVERMARRYRDRGEAIVAIVRRRTKKGGIEAPEVRRWATREEWLEKIDRRDRRASSP